MVAELNAYVFRAVLDASALAGLLANRFGGTATYAIVRRVDAAEFMLFNSENVAKFVERWTDGQIFDAESELRWQRSNDVYKVLLLTEKSDQPPDFQSVMDVPLISVDSSSAETHGFLLWGTTHTQDGWFEARIPRVLQYPVHTKKPPQLSYRLYQDRSAVRWVRLTGLKEVK